MTKGGYLGGGTIIGPRTPEWFTKEGTNAPVDTTPPAKTGRNGLPFGKTTRNQRRKVAKARAAGDVYAGKYVRVEPPQLTQAAEARIAVLRRDMKIHGAEVRSSTARLEETKGELRALLTRHALPLDEGL